MQDTSKTVEGLEKLNARKRRLGVVLDRLEKFSWVFGVGIGFGVIGVSTRTHDEYFAIGVAVCVLASVAIAVGRRRKTSELRAIQETIDLEVENERQRWKLGLDAVNARSEAHRAAGIRLGNQLADAQLQLQSFLNRKALTDVQQQTLIERMTRWSGQKVMFSVFAGQESVSLLRIIRSNLLNGAGWIRVTDSPTVPRKGPAGEIETTERGVTIQHLPDAASSLIDAAAELTNTLRDFGVAAASSAASNNGNPDTLFVVVGEKAWLHG